MYAIPSKASSVCLLFRFLIGATAVTAGGTLFKWDRSNKTFDET